MGIDLDQGHSAGTQTRGAAQQAINEVKGPEGRNPFSGRLADVGSHHASFLPFVQGFKALNAGYRS
jgi:hypothetical protein